MFYYHYCLETTYLAKVLCLLFLCSLGRDRKDVLSLMGMGSSWMLQKGWVTLDLYLIRQPASHKENQSCLRGVKAERLVYCTEKNKRRYLLPSHVQCSRFRAPSILFQCWRWKKAYATASLSPRFRMCSGGSTRLFISSKYWKEKQKGHLVTWNVPKPFIVKQKWSF